ncbi:MAG: hypothetical protein KC613_07945 [Myxococcales bacterium]|nr:hypothetical protein [Myxococcales bacterium]MCB9524123.1 hypothetical protein [Myxococcales bacterium]
MRDVFLVGGAHTPYIGKFNPDFIWKKHPDFGKRTNPDGEQLVKQVVADTFAATGATGELVDKAFIGNFAGELFENQGHFGALVAAADEGLVGKPITRVEAACASGGLALSNGFDAIRAGADIVLVVGAEVQNTRNAMDGADFLARASHYKSQREIDAFTFPALFARRIKAAVAAGVVTTDDLALASVKAYGNANKNPFAHMRAYKMELEAAKLSPTFLGNEDLKDWLRVSDCSQVSDGASALILASEAGLAKLGKARVDVVQVLSSVIAVGALNATTNPLEMTTVKMAAEKAYAAAGLKPADVQVAEVHDCFTIAEVLSTEAVGFAALGQGAALLQSGATQIDGKIPVNTGGGLVGFGHPVGATGVKQALEVFRQMKGQCGDYQMPTTPGIGLTANMGGDDRTAVVSLYKA